MSDDLITPALASEQWPYMQEVVASHPSGKLGWFVMAKICEDGTLELDIHGQFNTWTVADRHALAALCLHNQPFGFSQEDIRCIQGLIGDGPPTMGGHVHARRLAARVAALLPPSP